MKARSSASLQSVSTFTHPSYLSGSITLEYSHYLNPMELDTAESRHRLPQEIIDHICEHLKNCARDVRNVRLVCHAFNKSAEKLLKSIQQSPSELFTSPLSQSSGNVLSKQNLLSARNITRRVTFDSKDPTIWTCLHVPRTIRLEDNKCKVGKEFYRLMAGESSAPASRFKLSSPWTGRTDASWGRVKEKRDLFWIVLRK